MTRRTFEGKSVVVTGAAGGLGSAFSRRFGLEGSNLTLLDLESGKLGSLEKDKVIHNHCNIHSALVG